MFLSLSIMQVYEERKFSVTECVLHHQGRRRNGDQTLVTHYEVLISIIGCPIE